MIEKMMQHHGRMDDENVEKKEICEHVGMKKKEEKQGVNNSTM